MDEINWFADILGVKFRWYQKVILWLFCYDPICSIMYRTKYGHGRYQTFRLNPDNTVASHIYSGDIFCKVFAAEPEPEENTARNRGDPDES